MNMSYTSAVQHIVFALFLFAVSAGISWMLIKRTRILDRPNDRSSHKKPTPTIGGVAIVFTFFLSMLLIYFFKNKAVITQRYFLGFTFSSLLIAGISLYDDMKSKPFHIKILTHILAILIIMASGIIINKIDFGISLYEIKNGYAVIFIRKEGLGFAGYFITFCWMLGMINAYNFMDGLNGMAGGNAFIAAVFFSFISFSQGSNFAYIVSYTIAAGALGFLVFNFPKGKLFMGDVGSTFLGFAFAAVSIIASLYDNAHTSLLVIPLLFFHFIYDTLFTFTRRLFKGENVFKAHRSHLYQLLNRMGCKHATVTGLYWAMACIQGIGAIWMVTIKGPGRLLVFFPYLMFQIFYSIIIVICARKKKLL